MVPSSHVEEERRAREGELPGEEGQISMINEIRRKAIHLSSIGVPLIYWFVDWVTMLQLLIPATLVSLLIELLRRRFPRFEIRFQQFFGPILRSHESGLKPEVNGATFVLLAATICVAIFPKPIAITSFSVLIISDTAAALFGRRFGRRPFYRKSLEGSSAFFVTAMIVVLLIAAISPFSWTFIVAGLLAALVATGVEAISHGGSTIDDNLTIPTAFGAVMWGFLAPTGAEWLATPFLAT